ncbi:MAG: hypothetical protein Q4Q00_14405 [Turicibacter sp.]|nr:hypothetical protein [Turicibacter sp.]
MVNAQTIEELLEFKKKANSIISPAELDKAVLKNKIDLKEKMTDEEFVRLFDYIGTSLSKEEEVKSEVN